MSETETAHGYTVTEIAKRLRVGEEKVRAWITSGKLRAINTADVNERKPRYVVLPEALAEFERGRCVTPPPKPARRKRKAFVKDYFPD